MNFTAKLPNGTEKMEKAYLLVGKKKYPILIDYWRHCKDGAGDYAEMKIRVRL